MIEVSKAISSLSPEKRALLARKLKEQGGRFNTFPLSFAQQRLWLSAQLRPDSLAYNICSAVRLTGSLNVRALEQSLTEIVRRHEVLRTTFPAVDGKPVQVIAPAKPVSLPIVDLSALPESEREAVARRLAGEEAQRPFDLIRGPLLRFALLRLTPQERIVICAMHHIVSDAWSTGMLIRELALLHDAYLSGRPYPLPELPIQYADFASWQREWLQGETLDAQLGYWKKQLAGSPALLELPTDRPRPVVQTFRGGTRHFQLDPALTNDLKALSLQSGVTLYMTLLAAFVTLLSRYSGQEDIAVGASIANRNRKEMESLIGFVANTLVMRADLAGNPTFQRLLGRVRQVVLGAFAHQDLPFEKLVEELRPERSPGYNPLFQVFFVLQNAPVGKLELSGLTLSPVEIEGATAMFDLMLSMKETSGALAGSLQYNSDLFDAATIERMSKRFRILVENVTRDPDAAIADLQIDEAPALPVISPMSKAEMKAPLSYHQERLWFIDQFETGNVYESNPVYHNIPLILRLNGSVDCSLLEQSLNAIIERHAALRSKIIGEGDLPFQVVSPRESLELKVVDVAGAPDGALDGALIDRAVDLALDEARRPFALDCGLLVRAALFRMSDAESFLVLIAHHIIADRWSLRLIAKELAEIYGARIKGQALELPKLTLQYTDYTQWQRNLPADTLEPLLFYWRYQLRGKLQALDLPSQRPRPAIHTFTDARCAFSFDKRLADRIKTLSQTEGASEFAVLLAGFKALLGRYARQDEIIVGVSEPCRNQDGIKGVVGPFANLLALRSDLTGNPTFRAFLAQVGKTIAQARKHQEAPFDRLVLELNPEKDMSRTALFDVLFQFETETPAVLELGDVKARVVETNIGYGKYDLHLLLQGSADGLSGTVVYNADIYDDFMIEQMMRHYEAILGAMTSNPDQRISDARLLSEAEEHQQLTGWNATQASYPRDKTIHQLFEEQVAGAPDSVAVVYGEARLTYRDLDERANRLAHYLRRQGVKPETLVALCLDRAPEMIVAMLGALKAGGAYLPMDPEYPKERLKFMVEDAGVSHLIATCDLMDRVPTKVPSLILLDADREAIAAEPVTTPAQAASPNHVAYCIYTSGSTGKPKGALVEHRNVVRLVVNDKFQFTIAEDDIWTMFHSYCFDFSVWEMYGALLYGGTLVIVPKEASKDPALLLESLVRERVTFLNQTPTSFYNLAKEALKRPKSDLALRYVVFGGEALNPIQLREWRSAYPEVKLINMYGITETTVHVTFKEITDRDIREDLSNIGAPIPTTTTYILDSNLRLLPVGVPGEVCVGGDGVSRGYLNRGALTCQKFIPNPYRPEERVYRSGDIAKLLPNGEMEYLGRMDNQVQIRGFRVELGEIQSHLLKHPSVAEAVVVARKTQSAETQIVGYVAPASDVSVTALRNHLMQSLPHYMAPSAFVMLDALPLTQNGKVDIRALPQPEQTRPELEGAFVAPQTPVEEALAGIWAEVLGVDQVGVYDSFFDLGGHSLLATQVVSRAREAFQVELALRHIFEAPTVASLAERIETMLRADQGLQAPPIEPVLRDGPMPLSFAQQRLWVVDQMEPGNPAYNMPGAVRLTGALNVAALEASLNEIIRRHESLRAIFAAVDGKPVQVITPAFSLALPVVDLSERSEAEREEQVRKIVAEEALKPFDLAQGPLFRVCLLRLAAEEHVAVFSTHHIISDEWSLGVLTRELAALYDAFRQGRPSPLPELPVQYADYAHWQRRWLQGEALDTQLAYWRRWLNGALPVMRLPFDHSRPAAPTYRGATHSFLLHADVSASLKALSRQEGATLFMTLLAALQTLLHHITDQDDIIVGTVVANRNRLETEGLIGFFVNHLVLRADLGGNPGFRKLLRQAREVTLGAYAHQDLPFDKLVSDLRLERNPGQTPLFQVLFVFGNPALPTLELPGLTLSPLRSDLILSKYDLTLFMSDKGQSISGLWRYSAELFEAGAIARMCGQFETLLGSIAANPDARLDNLEILTEAERQRQDDEKRERQEARARRLRSVSREAVDLAPTSSRGK